MNIDTIKAELNGYFINRFEHNGEKVSEALCRKINNYDYEVLDNVRTPNGLMSAMDLLLAQVNNQILDPTVSICSLDEILPTVKSNVFETHKMRERKIQQHIDLCQSVETEENELSDGRYLVYYVKRGTKIYAIVHDDSLTEYPANLLDDEQLAKAIRVEYPKLLRTALRDDLINQYDKAYDKEVEKYLLI